MKKKLNRAYYWLFIVIVLSSCANEMDIADDERNPNQDIELFVLPDQIKAIFQFDKSMSENEKSSVEHILEQLYLNKGTKKLITYITELGLKIKIKMSPPGAAVKTDAYCKPYPPVEIGFFSYDRITLENLLHELLHLYAYNQYHTYAQGFYGACEEYEVRVLTDLLMSTYFNGYNFKYQGIPNYKNLNEKYKNWIMTLRYSSTYNPDLLKKGFQLYGAVCFINLGGFNDNLRNPNLNPEDFNKYSPLLLYAFWTGF